MKSATGRTGIACAGLFVGTLLLFSRAAHFGFLNLDDPLYVTANPVVQQGLTWAGVAWAFTAPAVYWHPLAWISHMLDVQLYGASPAGHHVTSVLWHAVNAVLALLLFQRLTGSFWRSALAAALFAWHPLRVESVAWIAERKDVMSGCFFLCTLLAYCRYASQRAAGQPGRAAYGLALTAFAAGLMSKPMVVTLPAVLLLLDFWPLKRHARVGLRSLVLEKLPFVILAAGAAAAALFMERSAGGFVLHLTLGARLANAVVSVARYLAKLLWPADLIVCYTYPPFWPALAVIGAAALLTGLVALAWFQRRQRPWILVGLGWCLITLLPVIGLFQVGPQAMADRFTYLPLLGIELAVVCSLRPPATRLGRFAAAALGAAALAGCALRTWNQEGFWKTPEMLFEHALRIEPSNDVAEDFLASALLADGRVDEAWTHATRAQELNPNSDRVRILLGEIREREGRVGDAIGWYRSALAIRPDNPLIESELALLELARGNRDEARRLLISALREKPALRDRTVQLAETATTHGDPATAALLYDALQVAGTHP